MAKGKKPFVANCGWRRVQRQFREKKQQVAAGMPMASKDTAALDAAAVDKGAAVAAIAATIFPLHGAPEQHPVDAGATTIGSWVRGSPD